jgi:AraC-like DNA-binding protein
MAAYGISAIGWFLLSMRMTIIFVPVATLSYVMILRMIRTVTDTGGGTRLSPWHFALPAVLTVAALASITVLPTKHLEAILPLWAGIWIAFSVVYPVMAMVRIVRFRRKIAVASNTAVANAHASLAAHAHAAAKKSPSKGAAALGNSHNSILWRFFWALLCQTLFLTIPVAGKILGLALFYTNTELWLVAVAPSLVIHIVSCLDLLAGNYLILENTAQKTTGQSTHPATTAAPASPARGLQRERVDQYIETRKPWLDPEFCIAHMAEDLYSNRAYISAFINREYGVNFSRFVNSFRLAEVERLKEEAARRRVRVSMLQLILNAGFGSYRSYLRAHAAASDDPANDPDSPDALDEHTDDDEQ